MITDTTSEQFFERKYRDNSDPWSFATSDYEQQRYAAIVAALAGRRYERAFEPGCSIGVLTEAVAKLCDAVEAVEISATAAKLARERCASLPNVSVRCSAVDAAIPASYDLLVFSEIGYYFSREDLRAVMAGCVASLRESGTVLAAHWLGTSRDHILSGDAVHEVIASTRGLILEHSERHEHFRLDRWRKSTEVCQ